MIIFIIINYYKYVCFKELAHLIIEAENPKFCQVSWQAGDPRELMV